MTFQPSNTFQANLPLSERVANLFNFNNRPAYPADLVRDLGGVPPSLAIATFARDNTQAATLAVEYANKAPSALPNARLEIHGDNAGPVRAAYREFNRLDFQFIDPDFTENVNPIYDEINILGRSEPYLGYAGGSTRDVQLTLYFASSVSQKDSGSPDAAVRCARFLQSLLYPTYADQVVYPPATCLLVLGNLFAARVVLRAAPVIYQGAWSGDDVDTGPTQDYTLGYPQVTQVSCDFIVHNIYPLGAQDFLPLPGEAAGPVQPSSSRSSARGVFLPATPSDLAPGRPSEGASSELPPEVRDTSKDPTPSVSVNRAPRLPSILRSAP